MANNTSLGNIAFQLEVTIIVDFNTASALDLETAYKAAWLRGKFKKATMVLDAYHQRFGKESADDLRMRLHGSNFSSAMTVTPSAMVNLIAHSNAMASIVQ